MPDLPSFDAAQRQLLELLAKIAPCEEVRWVFREDFYFSHQNRVITPRQVPSRNSALAHRVYDRGTRTWGVALHAAFVQADRAFCWISAPTSQVDAEHQMISSLKLSCSDPLPRVISVNALSWSWRRLSSPAYRRQLEHYWPAPLRRRVDA